MQLPLEPQKNFYLLLSTCSSFPQDLETYFNVSHYYIFYDNSCLKFQCVLQVSVQKSNTNNVSHLNLNKRWSVSAFFIIVHWNTQNIHLDNDSAWAQTTHTHSQTYFFSWLFTAFLTQTAKHLQFQECFSCISIIKAPGINTHHVVFVSFSSVCFSQSTDYAHVYNHEASPYRTEYAALCYSCTQNDYVLLLLLLLFLTL